MRRTGLLLAALWIAGIVAAEDADLDLLLKDIQEIVAPGSVVGPVAVFGEKAFPVVTGRNGKNRLPILAAARYGKGRVVLAGHEGLYGTVQRHDQRQLIVNTAAWLAGDRPKPIRVLVVDHRQVAPVLEEAGFDVTVAGLADLPAKLATADVLFLSGNHLTPKDRAPLIEAVAEFVRSGGGYFDGIPGWGWQQLNPRLSLANDRGGNKLTARMGLVIADGMMEGTGKEGFLADRVGLALTHAGRALAALESQARGVGAGLVPAPPGRPQGAPLPEELAQVSHTLTNACGALPDDDQVLLPRLHALVAKQGSAAVPMPKQPLGLDNPVGRIACVIENLEMRRAPVEKLKAHPAAAGFPGSVPPEAKRVEKSVAIDTSMPDWASTGLYAAPGEAIEVTLPDGAEKAGLGLRIGAHTDTLWGHDRWKRFPEISYTTSLTQPTTKFGNPFGGIVYITVPRHCKLDSSVARLAETESESPPRRGGLPSTRISVRIRGAVEMPYFVLGKTPPDLWRSTIRKHPAPFAELATRKIILIIPSSAVRDLDDPTGVLEVWDSGMDAIADLAAIPRDRERPERFCCDQQISAGYMHSGYPVMAFLDVPPTMVDREKMLKGGASLCWGFWHELGHNHQSGHWTFGGTGETTCNLFSLYCCERVSGEPVAKSAWLNVAERSKTVQRYFAGGAKFEEWCRDPGLSLMFYAQLQQAFGWDAFKRVFAAYRAARPEELPRNDDEKRDQFLIRFSRQVGRNLGPFFAAWGIPTSERARKSLEDLPTWLPPEFRNGIPFTAAP